LASTVETGHGRRGIFRVRVSMLLLSSGYISCSGFYVAAFVGVYFVFGFLCCCFRRGIFRVRVSMLLLSSSRRDSWFSSIGEAADASLPNFFPGCLVGTCSFPVRCKIARVARQGGIENA
jgi:hypothetical protein